MLQCCFALQASHTLPIIIGHFAGGQHVERAGRVCSDQYNTCQGSLALRQMTCVYTCCTTHVDDCPLLQPLRQQRVPLSASETDTIRWQAQKDHMQIFKVAIDQILRHM